MTAAVLRIKPTLESAISGFPAIQLRYPNFPSLKVANSPDYNRWFLAAAGNGMALQSHNHAREEAAASEIRRVATEGGVDLQPVVSQLQLMRAAQEHARMGQDTLNRVSAQETEWKRDNTWQAFTRVLHN